MASERDRVGIALLSFAHGHAQQHARILSGHADVDYLVCWDDVPERGRRSAAQHGIPWEPDLGRLLSDNRVDGVIITTETNRHPEFCEAAATAGKDILCYKPMATTLDGCDRIIAAARNARVQLMVGHQMVFDPVNIRMKELVDSGVIGAVSLLRRRHCINVLLNPRFVQGDSRWHLDETANVGMFFDDSVHATMWIRWMLGDPVSVTAEIDNTITDVAPDDTGVAIYRFRSGAFAVLTNQSVTVAAENTTEIYGERGTIIQNFGDAVSSSIPRTATDVALKLHIAGDGEPHWQDLGMDQHTPHQDRIAAVALRYVDMLMGRRAAWPSGDDGRWAVAMALGAYQSARSGRRVPFPLVHDGAGPHVIEPS